MLELWDPTPQQLHAREVEQEMWNSAPSFFISKSADLLTEQVLQEHLASCGLAEITNSDYVLHELQRQLLILANHPLHSAMCPEVRIQMVGMSANGAEQKFNVLCRDDVIL